MGNLEVKPIIVIAVYNRPRSFRRLLTSLSSANYAGYKNVDLVISIDGGGSKFETICKVADKFCWRKGKKSIIKHPNNLGLRRHIIYCGDLTQKYGAIILLESDVYVSKNFYQYALKGLDFYNDDKRIAGVSLYSYEFKVNEVPYLPFMPVVDGNDVYFAQIPSSWGQVWTLRQWSKFRKFYNSNPKILPMDDLPKSVKNWPETSWKKYFYKYMVEKDLYFVYPFYSFSTNFGDTGVHCKRRTPLLQTSLEYFSSFEKFEFVSFDESLNKYDAYFELSSNSLIKYGVKISKDTCVDLYGVKKLKSIKNKYLLSSKKCLCPEISFGNNLRAALNNLLYFTKGSIISYGRTKSFIEDKETKSRAREFFFGSRLQLFEESKNREQLEQVKSTLVSAEKELSLTRTQLDTIYSSRGWRLISILRKYSDLLFPRGSKRKGFTKKLSEILK